jgi:hypothetical protein
MIQYDVATATITYTKADGTTATSTPGSSNFNDLMERRSLQLIAAITNQQAGKNYTDLVANLQLSVNNGVAETAPVKPLMTVIADDPAIDIAQATVKVPFMPALPDLQPTGASNPSTTPIPSTTKPDPVQQILAMVTALFLKAFPPK